MNESLGYSNDEFLYCSTDKIKEYIVPCVTLRVILPLIHAIFFACLVVNYRLRVQPLKRVQRFKDQKNISQKLGNYLRVASIKWRMGVAISGGILDALGFFSTFSLRSTGGSFLLVLWTASLLCFVETTVVQMKSNSIRKRDFNHIGLNRKRSLDALRFLLIVINLFPLVGFIFDDSKDRIVNMLRNSCKGFGFTCAISMLGNLLFKGKSLILALGFFLSRTKCCKRRKKDLRRRSSTTAEVKLHRVKNRLKRFLTHLVIETYFVVISGLGAFGGEKSDAYYPFISFILTHFAGIALALIMTTLERKGIQKANLVHRLEPTATSQCSTAPGTNLMISQASQVR